jgi:hypothetical protein
MRIFYDLEFLEDGRTLDLISIGMVREDGRELYAVNDQLLRPAIHPAPGSLYERVTKRDWLMRNVVPHLPLKPRNKSELTHKTQSPTGPAFFSLDPEHPAVLPRRLIRAQVRDFILGGGPDVELWAWYGAFDHVGLAWLWGPMIDLPEGVPMFTNDIRTLALLAGPGAMATEPKQEEGEHNALADARHNETRWEHYMAHLKIERVTPQEDAGPVRVELPEVSVNRGGVQFPEPERPTIPVFQIPPYGSLLPDPEPADLPSWEGR